MSDPLKPNRPTPEGRELGAELARLTDAALAQTRAECPAFPDDRCQSCAYRGGTVPNGCLPTVMDALYSTLNREPFHCHQEFDAAGQPVQICKGWLISLVGLDLPPNAIDAINRYGEEARAISAVMTEGPVDAG